MAWLRAVCFGKYSSVFLQPVQFPVDVAANENCTGAEGFVGCYLLPVHRDQAD